MSYGMVRPALALAVLVSLAAPARATELPRRMGMFTPAGAPLAVVESKVAIQVHGAIIETVVTQTFSNASDRPVEATYIFPLPDDAAVSAMAIDYGTRKVHAAIALRKDAQRRYEDAVAAGVGAALLDQERPDIFTQTVSAIPAHGRVEVTLRYDTVAHHDAGAWTLALPMVVAPRYVPGTASGRPTTGGGRAPDTDRSPDASRVTPGASQGGGAKTEVTIGFADPVDDVTSSTHDIAKRGDAYAFVDAHSDHDAIVRWRAKAPAEGWVEHDDDGAYAAVLVEAPAAPAKKTAVRALFVLDRAATARGDTDAVAHPLVRDLFAALDRSDSVSVTGSIQSDWRTPDDVARAVEAAWRSPSGAFDLTRVLQATKARGAAVLLVTDGLVADDRAAIAAAKQVGAPIHVIGIGPAPNRSLLAAIATATGGTVRYATIGDDLDALAKGAIADVVAPPPLLAVSWGVLTAREVVPAQMPRLGAGQAGLVVARVEDPGHGRAPNARARDNVFGLATIAPSRALEGSLTPKGPLARRWARMKLDELIAAGDQRAIASHAMRFGLVSPATSMVAIGDDVVVEGGVKHTVSVPVAVPAGMHWQTVKQEVSVDATSTTTGTTISAKESPKLAEDRKSKHEAPAKNAPKRDERKDRRQNAPAETEPVAPAPSPAPERPMGGEVFDAPKKEPTVDKSARDDDAGADAEQSSPSGAPMPPPMAPRTAALDEAEGGSYNDEVLTIASERGGANRRLRFSLATGAVREAGNTSFLVAPRVSFEVGGRTRFGFEGSLWFVDGLTLEGTTLATFSRLGLTRWVDVVGGLGLHLGEALGPAVAGELRIHLPVRHVSTYLRYDGALLLHDSTRNGQNTGSIGVEASF